MYYYYDITTGAYVGCGNESTAPAGCEARTTAPEVPGPAAVVPQSVTMRQARLQLMAMGLLTQVNTTIANMAGVQGDAARIAWEFSSMVERTNPLFTTMQTLLGLTEADVDRFFMEGALL